MSSLDRHLRRLDDHGRLPFHLDCPACQKRLAGTPPREGLVSRRAQAGLVAGLLAVSALAPGASVAQPSHGAAQTARTQRPPPPPPVDPTLDPDWQPPGPEGPSLPEPLEAAPPASDDGQGGAPDEEAGPVESEPLQDTIPEPQESEAPPVAPAPPTVPSEAPPATVEEAPMPAPTPPAESPGPPVPSATPPAAAGELIEQPRAKAAATKRRVIRIGLEPRSSATPTGGVPPVTAPPPQPTAERAPASSPSAETVPVSHEVGAPKRQIDGGTYVVRPGDSLWSIARRLLGPGASPAQIAREVNRLWELNKDRISTGDPDLLRVGTELKL